MSDDTTESSAVEEVAPEEDQRHPIAGAVLNPPSREIAQVLQDRIAAKAKSRAGPNVPRSLSAELSAAASSSSAAAPTLALALPCNSGRHRSVMAANSAAVAQRAAQYAAVPETSPYPMLMDTGATTHVIPEGASSALHPGVQRAEALQLPRHRQSRRKKE